ncbi:hypothetical protein [Amycolatopsis taiwanensis]|uniref:PE domain-containing protein n=1 Tax=Amycolatopsis taiwanensis TaxID=342230 RepID=A0A9W6QWU8_9PSEU|nr:hypothetical protein [Amycolatopsis taiwanensis]GLY63913.1 hypothetical protein Atai01_05320 [Amycolatopsis taiwanensis]
MTYGAAPRGKRPRPGEPGQFGQESGVEPATGADVSTDWPRATRGADSIAKTTEGADAERGTVAQAPMLGTSPYAETVASHVQKGGTGQTKSADAVIEQLTAVFDEVRQALNKAKQAYEDNEHATVRKLK